MTGLACPILFCMQIPGELRFHPASDQSLIVYFGEEITFEVHPEILKLLRLLDSQPIAGIRNLHPAYCSLLIQFDPFVLDHDRLEKMLRDCLTELKDVPGPQPRALNIPVCYGGEFGPDLSDVARLHGMNADQVIELHSSATYVVHFLGFAPGFAYLGGLPKALETPRLPTPRRKVQQGSVAIAGKQAGVYPFATPGGWRLLGCTPEAMFQPDREHMSLLSIGDHVRFVPISQEEFRARRQA
jgi:KipI family sensor histidine kinase inhibitor